MIGKLGVLTLITVLLGASTAHAAPGGLDPAFGAGGLAVSNQQVDSGANVGFALLPNGDSAVVGTLYGDQPTDLDIGKLARFTSAGQLNETFRSGGKYEFQLGTAANMSALAASPDGRLIGLGDVVSGGQRGLWVAEFSPLSPFNYHGRLVKLGGLSCFGNGAAVQSDLKIVAASSCSPSPYIARVNTNLELDTGFNGSGYAPASSSQGIFRKVAMQPDGKAVVAGTRFVTGAPDRMLVVRYDGDGTLDSGFHDATSGSGRVNISPPGGSDASAHAVAIQADGKILVAGQVSVAGVVHPVVARLSPDGSLDGSFGSGGIVVATDHPDNAIYTGVAIQPDGKVVVVGRQTATSAGRSSVIRRLNSDGSPDPAFGSGGAVIGVPLASESSAAGVAVQPDGKIIVGEQLQIAGTYTTGVVRLLGDDPPGAGSAPAAKPSTKFKSPSKSKLKAKKFKEISGTATNAFAVQVAVLKTDKSLLKKKKRCSQLASARARFTKVKAVNKKCQPVKWLTATGTSGWKFKLKKTLPASSYTIYVRATGPGGLSTPAKKSLKLTE